jgi:3-methyladenine DNA glycosylase/8-oxoguanine DNA glycosylase
VRVGANEFIRAARTPDGPASLHLRVSGDIVHAEGWGPGATWMLDSAHELLGSDDDPSALEPRHPAVGRLRRGLAGLRMPRSSCVMEALLPAILEQKVTGSEARRSYRRIVRALGEPAPGPFDLVLSPAPELLAATPAYAFHPFGVERKRADIIRSAARIGQQLTAMAREDPPETRRRMRTIPGIGPWTEAEVARVAFGDADAVSLGDFHLPNTVAWGLAGEPRADDARMLELLEPYRGQRGRVCLMLELAGPRPPRYGPRLAGRSIETL